MVGRKNQIKAKIPFFCLNRLIIFGFEAQIPWLSFIDVSDNSAIQLKACFYSNHPRLTVKESSSCTSVNLTRYLIYLDQRTRSQNMSNPLCCIVNLTLDSSHLKALYGTQPLSPLHLHPTSCI